MDNHLRLADFVEWDVQNWSVALDYWQTNSTHCLEGCSALEVGSRNGGLSLWMALQGAKVVCSDVSAPTERAVRQHRESGVSHLVEYQSIDATAIPYTEQFDVILFKSVLGAVGGLYGKEAQAKAVQEMHRALKKDGELFFVENLVASPFHKFVREKYVKWGAKWRYVTIAEMKEFLKPFAQVRLNTMGFAGTFGRSERQRDLLGRFDKAVFERLVPDKWKYIVVGVARK